MASPRARRIATAAAEQALLPPDEILQDIFLRLDSGPDLARASATCRAFRRVATGRSFLRRFRSLHPPPVVGFIHFEAILGLQPAEPPHRSAPAARALAQAGDYSFSFLPNDSWRVCDVRDGRSLLSRDATNVGKSIITFLELVVCDPLHRRYVQIPPIPEDLVPCVPSWIGTKSDPFFGPSDEEDLEKVSHFRVIYNWLSYYKIVGFLFSGATGKWRCATTFSFSPVRLILEVKSLVRCYARGCFYWTHLGEQYMLVLDPCVMKFSLVLHDKDYRLARRSRAGAGLAFIDAGEDRLGFLTVRDRTLCLYTKTCKNNGVGAEEWRHDKSISLPMPHCNYSIISTTEGYLLLKGSVLGSHGELKIDWFAVNLETFLVERLCVLNGIADISCGHPYATFPPPLSLPSL